jgi:mono/diheme cytochrome c family protein
VDQPIVKDRAVADPAAGAWYLSAPPRGRGRPDRSWSHLYTADDMRFFSRTILVCYADLIMLLAGPERGPAQDAFADHRYTGEAIEAGSRVYVANCALCHGANGDGMDGVDLRRGWFLSARSDEDLRGVITSRLKSPDTHC